MSVRILIFDYFVWHYTAAMTMLWRRWRDVFLYILHLFSVRVLLHTLLAPLKRIHESYAGRSLEDQASALVVNLFSRVLGLVARVVLLAVAGSFLIAHVVLFPIWFLVWFFAPIGFLTLITLGVIALF